MDNGIARLEWLLTRLELLDSPDRESEEKKQLYQEICKLVFEDQLYVRIWSEPTLNRLNQLFQTEKPGEELFDALDAANLFPRQAKFFKRLEALAQLRLGRFADAELLYGKLTIGGRPDWWILKEHGHVLKELGRSQDALTAMSKAALSNRKLEAMVSLFSDIGFLCRQTNLKQDARNHLLLSKHIREKHGWAVSQAISVGLTELNQELSDLPGPEDFDRVLAECQRFWKRTVGAQYDSREPSLKSRGVKRTVKGKLKLGPPERPYCFLHSDTRESYFCLKSDLPNGVTDGVTLQFDALPSFDKKKNQESWKAINVRTM